MTEEIIQYDAEIGYTFVARKITAGIVLIAACRCNKGFDTFSRKRGYKLADEIFSDHSLASNPYDVSIYSTMEDICSPFLFNLQMFRQRCKRYFKNCSVDVIGAR
jgi:uncharacterized protein YozE (UPF0346 family)